ncbi:MAG: L-rhamnose mutarotase [Solirubrobacterales bacterium]|nr:L-rhamnose mutarotase [Solirubrobacterales bacterium]
MERVCFLLRVRADRLDEYRERHRAVWSEMREALVECGWGNYTLFLRADGLLVGYLECEDFAAAQRCMEARAVNARWQAEMAPFFELPTGDRPGSDPAAPGRGAEEAAGTVFERLEEVFHLA